MSDELSFAEIECQHVELLPARTVLSVFKAPPGANGDSSDGQADAAADQADATADKERAVLESKIEALLPPVHIPDADRVR